MKHLPLRPMRIFALLALLAIGAPAIAADAPQAAAGIKETLSRSVEAAIAQLGKPDGFLADKAVRIAVPKPLEPVAKTARRLGQGQYVDQLETAMNHAAEQAVPAAAEIFGEAIRAMSVQDALGIVGGSKDAATAYFRRSSGEALRAKMLPLVAQATDSAGVTKAYKQLTDKGGGKLAALGASRESLDLDRYVTDKALDGLFHTIAEQEAQIRDNPVATGSALLQSLFGPR
ncbi:MAG TPA: DUF4197 domain-containing protein [Dokdonella sp.]|uniref:DUF4197 domain-containing protein n=1 Tax=Dokdonella sp. TaxID=2291710 RepID=UPI002BA10DB3|nr:DUF4197 domain-containing protein [Dokdonella sp.]HUD41278.1 DUF4197 domain-containing protein [Dokdonella sp.]